MYYYNNAISTTADDEIPEIDKNAILAALTDESDEGSLHLVRKTFIG